MSHETLAGLTGLARPTLTSLLNDFEKSGIIKKKNRRLIIIQKQKLSDIIDNPID